MTPPGYIALAFPWERDDRRFLEALRARTPYKSVVVSKSPDASEWPSDLRLNIHGLDAAEAARRLSEIGVRSLFCFNNESTFGTLVDLCDRLGCPMLPEPGVYRKLATKIDQNAFIDGLSGIRAKEARLIHMGDTIDLPERYPVVVKPADLHSQAAVAVVGTPDAFLQAVLEAGFASKTGRVIVESFVEGVEYEAVVFVHESRARVCVQTERVRGRDGCRQIHAIAGHAEPDLSDLLEQIVLRSGIVSGFLSVQAIWDGSRWYLVEVMHRLLGGYYNELIRVGFGVEPLDFLLPLLTGAPPPELVPRRPAPWTALTYLNDETLPGAPTGQVLEVDIAPALRRLAVDGLVQIAAGMWMWPRKHYGYVTAHGHSRQDAVERSLAAAACVRVRTA